MTYDTLISAISIRNSINLSYFTEVIEDLLYEVDTESDCIDALTKIDDLVSLFCDQTEFEGDDDDFHNLSVAFARSEQYFNACRVLEKGLSRSAYSVDLLSDYLNYGMKCGKTTDCDKAYQKLKKIRNDWNWRAYQFSIDYLKERKKSRQNLDTNEIENLVNEFVKRIPDREESYLEKAEYLQAFGPNSDSETFLTVLTYATSDECPIQRTPKCDLTLADYYYNTEKDLDKAQVLIDRCKRNSVEVQLSVNRNYVFLLSALCGMSRYYDSRSSGEKSRIKEGSPEWDKIMEIYLDYHTASSGKADSRVRKCKEIIEAFIRETSVPYPYEDDGIENSL